MSLSFRCFMTNFCCDLWLQKEHHGSISHSALPHGLLFRRYFVQFEITLKKEYETTCRRTDVSIEEDFKITIINGRPRS